MDQRSRGHLIAAVIEELRRCIILGDPSRFAAWGDLGLTFTQLQVLLALKVQPARTAGV